MDPELPSCRPGGFPDGAIAWERFATDTNSRYFTIKLVQPLTGSTSAALVHSMMTVRGTPNTHLHRHHATFIDQMDPDYLYDSVLLRRTSKNFS